MSEPDNPALELVEDALDELLDYREKVLPRSVARALNREIERLQEVKEELSLPTHSE